MKLKKGDVVEVTWGDAWSATGWEAAGDGDCKAMTIVSVGVFVHQNKNGLLMTHGLDPQGKSNGGHFVPKGMIDKITLIRKGKKKSG